MPEFVRRQPCEAGYEIPAGASVVLALDGSFSQDCTVIVVASMEKAPHLDLVAIWEPPPPGNGYRVPVADVEQILKEACSYWQVSEIVCDPFRWTRSIQALQAEGLPMVEYPQSAQRMTPATTRLYEAVINGTVTVSDDVRLARHVANATLKVDSRGHRLAKEHKHSSRRIDAAVAAVMAFDRAAQAQRSYDLLDSVAG